MGGLFGFTELSIEQNWCSLAALHLEDENQSNDFFLIP